MKNSEKNGGNITPTKTENEKSTQSGSSQSKLLDSKEPSSITAMFKEGKWVISGYEAIAECAFCILQLMNDKKKSVFAIGIGTDVICDKPFKSAKEAKEYMKVPQWDMIWNLCNMMFEKKIETLKNK